MRSILSELISWLKGCRYGYTYKDKIIAIEASPTIFEMLRSNCKLNNLVFPGSNVLLINKAISDKDDITTEFYEKHSMSTMLKEFLTNLQQY